MGKVFETGLSVVAKAGWHVFQAVNRLIPDSTSPTPKWADQPLAKSYQKIKPTLGWPRETDSLCPVCVKELRHSIISGEQSIDILRKGKPAEIKAQIIEKEGKLLMVKECPKHGKFEDVLSIDPRFTEKMERHYPGSDFYAPDKKLRDHGSSSIKFGRGSVLNVDLTNRCNMMCEPCFTDANQVGYVYEPEIKEIKDILDKAISIKPKRQLSVQFSGGEPTLNPIFIEAIRYAKKVGYFSVQCATNGIRFAEDPEFAKAAYEAGLRIAYLQFDGVGNEMNSHRKITNLFDIKLRAIENLYNAGVDVVLVVTLVNTINDHQVGPIFDFAVANSDKISFIAFQPVSFTGRDEEISDEERKKLRYTLTHLVHDFKKQTGMCEPHRDWFTMSAMNVFSDFADMMAQGAKNEWGCLNCGCHPHCGISTAFFVNKKTKEKVALGKIMNIERLLKDVTVINDKARSPRLSKFQLLLSILRNYNPLAAPKNFSLKDFIQKFDKQSGGSLGGEYGEGKERKADKWLLLFVAGMWFQDLWTYDFRRTERCVIPYGTEEGEISFCAYNTGIGWRQIIEHVYKKATVGEWYKEKGRHPVYASRQPVYLDSFENTLTIPGKKDYDATAVAFKAKDMGEYKKAAGAFSV